MCFFSDIRNLTIDPYWSGVLESFSKGIFPKDFKFEDNNIFIGHEKVATINTRNIKSAFVELMTVLKRHHEELGFSHPEYTQDKLFEENISDNYSSTNFLNNTDDWKCVKKKSEQIKYISNFCEKIGKDKGMSSKKIDDLKKMIESSKYTGKISYKNVTFKDGEISDINNLIWKGDDFIVDGTVNFSESVLRKIKKENKYIKHVKEYFSTK